MEKSTEIGDVETNITNIIAKRACDKLFKFPEAVRLDDPDLEGAISLLALSKTLEQTLRREEDQLGKLKTKAEKEGGSWGPLDISLHSTEVQCATMSLVGAKGSLAQIEITIATNHGIRGAAQYLERTVNQSIREIVSEGFNDPTFYLESDIYRTISVSI
jgi:hypothetical protein